MAAALAADADEGARRLAVVVGHNDGGPGRISLRYAHRDAASIADVLSELGGVADQDLVLLLDPDRLDVIGTLSDIRARIDELPHRTEVLFFYSGHSDETGLLLGDDRMEYADLRSDLDALGADVRIAILDSCASGGLLRTKGGRSVVPFLADESSRTEGFAYIASSRSDEAAQEADDIQASFFTHYLTTGLRGAADSSGDGRITLHEAYEFTFNETLERTERTRNGPQHASYEHELSGSGDLVLTDLNKATGHVVLGADVDGSVSVRDTQGRLIAELDKEPGTAVNLAVPAGLYTATVVRDGTWAEADVDASDGAGTLASGDLDFQLGAPTTARGVAPLPESQFRVNVFPGLYDDAFEDHIVVNLGLGVTEELDGIALGVGGSVVRGDAKGAMATLGVNAVKGDLRGVAVALGYNETGSLHGATVALGGNVQTGEQFVGVQGALGFNHAAGDGKAFQLSLGFNGLSGTTRGLQVGALNQAKDLTGTQLGLLNVGGHIDGVQVGLINYADELDGVPFGLVNIIRDGRQAVAIYTSPADLWNVDLRFGGKTGMYTVVGARGDGGTHAGFQAGVGAHVGERFWTDFDVLGGA